MKQYEKEIQWSELSDEQKELKKLEAIYKKASEDCASKIAELSARTDLENIQSIVYQKQYQEALKNQIDGVLLQLQSDSFNSVSDYLGKCYESGYVGSMYSLHKQGIPLIMPIDTQQVVEALNIDSKLSQGLYKRLGEDTNYLKKSIRAEISRGIANGSSWNEMANKISNGMTSPFTKAKNNAMRIVRTEGHRVQVTSQTHAMKKAVEKGANIVKQWDASLDGRTRPSHAMVDGEIREMDEVFSNGLLYPSDPNGSAAEVCNCRCALLQRAKWGLGEEELDELKKRAEYFGLDKSENFEDFKKKYLKVTSESVIWDLSNNSNYEFKTKKDAINYFKDIGIKFGDSRKYPMDEQMIINSAQWHMNFNETFATFNDAIIHKLPQIKNVAPSSLGTGVLGQFEYYTNGVVDGIKLNSQLQYSYDYASKFTESKFNSGWFSGKNPNHTFVHEYGHYVSHSMNELDKGFEHRIITETIEDYKKLHPEVPYKSYVGFDDEVSRYATYSESEMFAECFSEYFSEETPREFAKIFGDKLVESLKGVK